MDGWIDNQIDDGWMGGWSMQIDLSDSCFNNCSIITLYFDYFDKN